MSADDISEAQEIDDYLARCAITDIALHIAKAADGRDDDALRPFFLPDAVMVIDRLGTFEGVNAIIGSLGVLRALDLTQHVIANSLVELSGYRATMLSYFIAMHVKHDHPGGPLFTVGGQYVDELEKTATGWRISQRTAQLLWSSGNAAILLKDVE